MFFDGPTGPTNELIQQKHHKIIQIQLVVLLVVISLQNDVTSWRTISWSNWLLLINGSVQNTYRMKSYIDDSDLFHFIFTRYSVLFEALLGIFLHKLAYFLILEVGDMAKIITSTQTKAVKCICN